MSDQGNVEDMPTNSGQSGRTDTPSRSLAWGQPITNERQEWLRAKLRDWNVQGARHRKHLGPFHGVRLIGADVTWLAAQSLWGDDGTEESSYLESLQQIWESGGHGFSQDFRVNALCLAGADLTQADLTMAFLAGADLRGAILHGADLTAAILKETRFSGARLSSAILLGADLEFAKLKKADLYQANLCDANLLGANLQKANLVGVHLEGAVLDGAQLEQCVLHEARLPGVRGSEEVVPTDLRGASLVGAHLDGADLKGALLQGVNLREASLKSANLKAANLEGADLRGSRLDSKTVLHDISLDVMSCLGDIHWGSGVGSVDLTRTNWGRVRILGDERNLHKASELHEHEAAVRAYLQLAVQLRSQGISSVADRFTYRAQIRQRTVLLMARDIPQYLGSWILALLAGYGYRPGRTVLWYAVVIIGFAFGFSFVTHGMPLFGLTTLICNKHVNTGCVKPLEWYEALILSISSFHGRGFYQPLTNPGDPVAILAAGEAVLGLFIEISFIAAFTQRFFSR